MQPPAIPADEAERLAALIDCSLLDTPDEERFDRLTRLARQMFGTRIVLISLVDSERQWFKSRQGLDVCETGRDISFCGHAILDDNIFQITDARLDPRFADNPLVTAAPHIRFYAGAPLRNDDGHRIGTLCIIDDRPRELGPDETASLRDLADCVEMEISLNRQRRRQDALLTLTRITSLSEADPETSLRRALAIGCEYLGLPFGIISEINGDDYRVQVQISPPDTLSDGMVFPLGRTYCSLTLQADNVLDIAHMRHSDHSGHPCYQDFGLESYIGVPLQLEDRVHGTLNFSSPEPRSPRQFPAADIEFVRLLGRWVSATLARWQLDKSLQRHQRLNDAIARAQSQFIRGAERGRGFDALLRETLNLTNSSEGFIAEVLHGASFPPRLRTYAIAGAAHPEGAVAADVVLQDPATQCLDAVLCGEPIIANAASPNPLHATLPDAAPTLAAFLGLPVHYAGDLVAVIGIANRPGGYDNTVIDFLNPLLTHIGQLVEAARSQERRIASEHRLRAIIEGTRIGTWEWNVQTGETVFNERWAEITGYRLDELAPVSIDTWMGLAHPDDLEQSNNLLQRHFAGELDFYDMQCRMRHRDGHWIWVHDRGRVRSWTGDGAPLLMSGTHADITEQKQAELALQRSEARLRGLFELSPVGIALNDYVTGAFLEVNDALLAPTGYSREAFTALSQWDLTPAEYEAEEARQLESLEKTGRYGPYEKEYIRRDGSRYPVLLNGMVVYDSSGRKIIWSIVEDMTERKRVERMKREFVSIVSHELRTPLTSITGALGLIAGGALGGFTPQAGEMIDIAHKNSQRLTQLINDLLDIEKLALGKLHFDFQPQPLMPLVELAIDTSRALGVDRRVTLRLVGGSPDLIVRVDDQRLLQVLSNLLSNAIKYSPDDGRVDVEVQRRAASVRISVTDHGPGVPTAFRDNIFQRFAQADSSDTRQRGGTGLGLAISRELVEHMGGSIGFDSVEGMGASFHFDLPLSEAGETAATGTPPDNGRQRVLVVQDDPDSTALLEDLLRDAGVEVDVAGNGAQALAALRQVDYAAMTLDMALPDMNGMDVIRQVRAHPRTADLPVVVISARVEDGRLSIDGDVPGIHWLARPVDKARLLALVDRLGSESGRPHAPRVLHVEDDAGLHRLIRAMVGTRLDVDHADTLQRARERLLRERFEVIILDICLPDGSGWELLPDIRARQPEARIVVLTGTDSTADEVRQVETFLLKSELSHQQLLDTIDRLIEPHAAGTRS